MKKITPKEKDEALEYLLYGNNKSIKPSQEVIDILISDGYVERFSPILKKRHCINDKGKGFFLQGGYTQERHQRRRQTFIFYTNMVISALVSAIVSYIVSSMNK